jgi:hypothetical protein
VWVEHTSSSGRVYYYNKKNGVSQWERPPSMAKRTKTDDCPTKPTSSSSGGSNKHSSHSHSSPTHSHSSHSQHTSHSHSRGSGSHRGYSSSSTHHSSHSSHHASHSSQGHHDRMRERDRGHGSYRRSNRGSRSSSKSASVSPTSSGRGRGPHDKTTPNRHSSSRPHHGGRGGSKRGSVSPRVSATSKQSSVSTVAVSPCTPSIPHGISQSLVATQQVINQTSAIIKHQQKLLSASGDPATPNTLSPPPSFSSSSSTKHTSSLPHPHARQKLVFQSNGPLSQEVGSGGGGVAVSTPSSTTPLHNPVTPGTAVDMSPQMTGLESMYICTRGIVSTQICLLCIMFTYISCCRTTKYIGLEKYVPMHTR